MTDANLKLALIEALQRLDLSSAADLLARLRLFAPADGDLPALEHAFAALGGASTTPAAYTDPLIPLAPESERLRVLFVQNAPCIRNYKTAVTLRARGHRVTLAYTDAKLSQMYQGLSDDVYDASIPFTEIRELWDLAAGFDLVHCHNEPDVLSVGALAGPVPVVHDTHDMMTLRHPTDATLAFFEAVANRGAAGRVYTSPYVRDIAAERYGIDLQRSAFTYNYALRRDLPERALPKRSAQDGEVHFVYQGGVGVQAHRDFRPLFAELARLGCHVHVYPSRHSAEYEQLAAVTPRLHYHGSVSPRDIIGELTQYDFGLVPFRINHENRTFLDTALPNKLFEYLAAGLPVAAARLKSLELFSAQEQVGIVYDTAQEIVDQLGTLKGLDVTAQQERYLFEQQYDRLEALYRAARADRPLRLGSEASHAGLAGGDGAAALPSVAPTARAPHALRAEPPAREQGAAF
jgi:glycosyltransferase involved in cell wall biosynthesis